MLLLVEFTFHGEKIVSLVAIFSVVTQRSPHLRDDTKNGCVTD